jgi:hypothetical protein
MIKTKIEKLQFELPDWNEIVECYDKHIRWIKSQPKPDMTFDENSIDKKIAPFRVLDNLYYGCILQHGYLNPKIKKARELLFGDEAKLYSAHIYVSFSSHSKSFPLHNDAEAVYIWQLIGNTPWKVDVCNNPDPLADHSSCLYDEFTLNPNEMFYIPRYKAHQAMPSMPRASVSFSKSYIYYGDNYENGQKLYQPYEEIEI